MIRLICQSKKKQSEEHQKSCENINVKSWKDECMFMDWNEVIMQMVIMLMKVAPYGVFCLLAVLFSKLGWEKIAHLGY